MAQRLAVIDQGRVVQCAAPDVVYHTPAAARVMDLIGFPHANLIAGQIAGGTLAAGPLRFAATGSGDVVAGIRPEHLQLGAGGQPARVTLVENLGGEAVVYLDMDGHKLIAAMLLMDGSPPEIDATVGVSIDPATVQLFDAASGLARGGVQGIGANG